MRDIQCIVVKTADRIRMPFDIIGRTGVGIGSRKESEFGVSHYNQMGTLRRMCATASQRDALPKLL